jgi:hypothetical protein
MNHREWASAIYHIVYMRIQAFLAQLAGAEVASIRPMKPINFIALLEEMVDLKVQQHTESHLKTTPEIAMVLAQKRETDRRRLDQIRAELIRVLTG